MEELLKSHLYNHTGFILRAKDCEVCYSDIFASKNKGVVPVKTKNTYAR